MYLFNVHWISLSPQQPPKESFKRNCLHPHFQARPRVPIVRSFKLAPECRAHNTRRNGCGTRPGFNAIIQNFPLIPMVCDSGEVFRDFLMSPSALLLDYSVSLMCKSMAFVWEDKEAESNRERNTQIVRASLSGKVVYSSRRLLRDVVCKGWLYRSLVDLLAPSVSSRESKVPAVGSHVQTARWKLPAGQSSCFCCPKFP